MVSRRNGRRQIRDHSGFSLEPVVGPVELIVGVPSEPCLYLVDERLANRAEGKEGLGVLCP